MRYIITLLLCIGATASIYAQHLVQGSIMDENSAPLIGATVVLLEPVDSSMTAFAISDSDGRFTLEDVEAGDYILQLSFVFYRTDLQAVTIGGEKKMDLGTYNMEPVSEILQEVTVKAEHIPMGVIGDTISYNAAAFKTKPGATVEDLLKKLPGVEVQRDGSIKAMGEDVQNVLVDGKEFFGDDPKIATKNLEAEAVDKVQVFDKKSEVAEFTGIDDGEEEKTINLKLKEGYKNGGFGTAQLAGGTESTYDGKLNYNRFSPKMQAAVILSGNNINKQAFSFNEYISFMGGLGNAISSTNSGMNFSEFGGAAPQGITENISSGLNFNYDLSSKLKLRSHYFFIDADQDLDRRTQSSQFTEDFTFETVDQTMARRLNRNHRLQAKLEYKPNPFTQVKWSNTLSSISNRNTSLGSTEFMQMGVSTGLTTTDVLRRNLQQGIEGSLTLRKKYDKKGRNWINTARYQYGVMDEDNNLQNQIQNANSILDIIQDQSYDYQRSGLTLQSAYTEPLSKRVFLTGQYEYRVDRETPERLFFDVYNEEGVLNTDLSRSYIKTNQIHKASLGLRRNTKKLKMTAGLGIQSSRIQGAIEDEQRNPINDLDNKSLHVLPHASFDYDLSKNDNLSLSYHTGVQLPTLNQLAPLPDNTNPNLLVLGNPELVPTYSHDVGLYYRSVDQFNFKNFFAHLNLRVAENQVINAVSIDDDLIRTLRPVNSDSYASLQSYMNYSAPIRALKLKYSISSRLRWSGYDSYINDQLSKVNETNATLNFTLDNRNKEHVDISSGVDLSLTNRKYDINQDFNQSFLNYSLFLDGIFYLGDTWSIASKYDYRSFSGEFFAAGQEFHLWSASIQKTFAQDKVAISLRVNDILNQTQGVERSGGLNSLYDMRYNTRARYITLGLKVKLGKKKSKGMTL